MYRIGLFLPTESSVYGSVNFSATSLRVEPGEETTADIEFSRPSLIVSAQIEESESGPVLYVAWERDERATSYDLVVRLQEDGHGMSWRVDAPELPTAELFVRLPLDKLFLRSSGWGASERGMHFAGVFGIQLPGAKLFTKVTPLDDAGESLLGTRTLPWQDDDPNPYEALVDLPDFPLSHADHLLLERRYEEAIAAYEDRLGQDPNDEHSLRVLAYLFAHGVDLERTYQDPSRAQELTKRLAEVRGEPMENGL